jgi:hypothetical protein
MTSSLAFPLLKLWRLYETLHDLDNYKRWIESALRGIDHARRTVAVVDVTEQT